MFTDVNTIEELAGNRIHRLENIMSMDITCHRAFDELVLNEEGKRHSDTVIFSTETEYALPLPAFLALHALCCEAAWMSGAAEHIVDVERWMDKTRVLAKDGSTTDGCWQRWHLLRLVCDT
ncbi:hypothetical protein EDC04DRAFT_2687191 [Pisolithus marmoratus]|nr:hypothetical protein EDC04DRAFT_2687191 [Pisolithus marmoratus]